MSLDDVAKVTKIQPRILERLEAGKLDGLPAEVFVRGFVRSFARCVGLDEGEALRRYAACSDFAAGTGEIVPAARALVEAMAELVPASATAARATPRKMLAVEVVDLAVDLTGTQTPPPGMVVETLRLPETGTVVLRAPIADADAPGDGELAEGSIDLPRAACAVDVASVVAVEGAAPVDAPADESADEPADEPVDPPACAPGISAVAPDAPTASELPPVRASAPAIEPPGRKKKNRRAKRSKRAQRTSREVLAVGTPPSAVPVVDGAGASGTWSPRMPPIATAPTLPWRRPTASGAHAVVVPSLVIDDADPESAERLLESRAEKHAPRRSFLPPILQDREDRSARQGGLTLAVIILLIAATLTLSYLMRRPSASGDGMTRLEAPAQRTGVG